MALKAEKEKAMVSRREVRKTMINTHSLFSYTIWRVILNLSDCLPLRKCIKGYLARQNALGNCAMIVQYLGLFKGVNSGGGGGGGCFPILALPKEKKKKTQSSPLTNGFPRCSHFTILHFSLAPHLFSFPTFQLLGTSRERKVNEN